MPPWRGSTSAGSTAYNYDANGNRTSTASGYQIGPDNQILNDGTYAYTYDGEGNEATKTGNTSNGPDIKWTYSYDNANHLTKAVETNRAGTTLLLTVNYYYDVFGNRDAEEVIQGSTDTVTKFAYDGWNPATPASVGNENFSVWADLSSTGSLTTQYLYGDKVDQILARVDSHGTGWFLTDNQGSVRKIIDNNGNLVASVDYDAYGNINQSTLYQSYTGALGRYTWTGREFDVETDLQYNRARFYDPSTGRWISQDPMGFDAGDSNLYRYVNNAPTDRTDPSGLEGEYGTWEFWADAGKALDISGSKSRKQVDKVVDQLDTTYSLKKIPMVDPFFPITSNLMTGKPAPAEKLIKGDRAGDPIGHPNARTGSLDEYRPVISDAKLARINIRANLLSLKQKIVTEVYLMLKETTPVDPLINGQPSLQELVNASNEIADTYIRAVDTFLKDHPGARPKLGARNAVLDATGISNERNAPWCADWAPAMVTAMVDLKNKYIGVNHGQYNEAGWIWDTPTQFPDSQTKEVTI